MLASFGGGDSFVATVKAYSTSTPRVYSDGRPIARRTLQSSIDIMTPITERSHESDRTFGQSTVRSQELSRLTIHSHLDETGIEDTMARFSFDRPHDLIENPLENPHEEDQFEEVQGEGEEEYDEEEEIDLTNLPILDVESPCDPTLPILRRSVMTRIPQPSDSHILVNLEDFSQLGELLRNSTNQISEFDLECVGRFCVADKIGEGGYGSVYMVKCLETLPGAESFLNEVLAIKVQAPPTPWEYYVVYMLKKQMALLNLDSEAWYCHTISCHVFQNESLLLMNYYPYGSLLDCVNKATVGAYGSNGGFSPGVDESLAAFWTIEILKMLETMHSAGVVHGDVKIDNFLLRMPEEDDDESWDSNYHPDGSHEWNRVGLVLIDWGMAIDLHAFPESQMFHIPIETDPVSTSRRKSVLQRTSTLQGDPSTECFPVRHDLPWKFEPDWYGVAGILHVLLFGKYMKAEEVQGQTKLVSPLKRYWHPIWAKLFDHLLNDPDASSIHSDCIELQAWLVESGQKKSLKSLLRRVQSAMLKE